MIRKKKKKENNNEVDYDIKRIYEHDILIIKNEIKKLNIPEKLMWNEKIDYSSFNDIIRNLGFESKVVNVKKILNCDVDHKFIITTLYDGNEEKKILIDLEFIMFYPTFNHTNKTDYSWIGHNLMNSSIGIELLNKIVINNFILINDKNLKIYLDSFLQKNDTLENIKTKRKRKL